MEIAHVEHYKQLSTSETNADCFFFFFRSNRRKDYRTIKIVYIISIESVCRLVVFLLYTLEIEYNEIRNFYPAVYSLFSYSIAILLGFFIQPSQCNCL